MQNDLLPDQCMIKSLLGRLVLKRISILTISFWPQLASHDEYLCMNVFAATPISIYITKIHLVVYITYVNLKIICLGFLGDLWSL
jgi:hypothetical protein